jgi:Uma2 family endonuclease
MATKAPPGIPLLRQGDHLTWPEFERRYDAMPELKKAELIEGVVYMTSPLSYDPAEPHFNLIGWLIFYRMATPGIRGGDNGTIRLDDRNAPQPDAFLCIQPAHGGQSDLDEKRYIAGAPELVAEVAVSSVSIDLHDKKRVYEKHGVCEYMVWRVEDEAVDWFVLRGGQYTSLVLGSDGVIRSECFPGLWLDPAALIGHDLAAVLQTLQMGIASPEHAAFEARLQQPVGRDNR